MKLYQPRFLKSKPLAVNFKKVSVQIFRHALKGIVKNTETCFGMILSFPGTAAPLMSIPATFPSTTLSFQRKKPTLPETPAPFRGTTLSFRDTTPSFLGMLVSFLATCLPKYSGVVQKALSFPRRRESRFLNFDKTLWFFIK
jgi:hypothetical protein